ncbi:hypothetical protein SLS64_012886 [Diaporthe eres]|uniref:F-box domain-containing protein n=1 Tax=Diaporthe eres TaxID=83184 RepID=A0ABR1PGB3_DIAER
MDEVGAALPTDEHTTESAVVADVDTLPSPEQLTPEHVCIEDIGTQLINIESIQQTIRTHVWNLENKPTETTAFELRLLLPRLDGLQSSLRKTFTAHARPSIRKLHIFQLPDELLIKISENVRGDFNFEDDKYSINGIKGIKNLRLACRRLCDASSHLLLHRLNVALISSSLKHLDRVSRHPTISKGIRSLRIYTGLYHPIPENDLQSFITEVLSIMRDDYQSDLNYLSFYAQEFEPQPSFEASYRASPREHEKLCESVKSLGERERIVRSYTNFLRTGTYQSDEDQNMAILRQVYHRLLNDQTDFLRDDTFVTIVAEAVARMPMVAGLSITDHLNFKLRLPSTEMSGPLYAPVRKRLLKPRTWDPELVSLLPQKPFKLLYQFPLAFIRAGNPLTELRISLKPNIDHKMRLGEELVKDLVSAAEHLKVLEIDCELGTRAVQSGGQQASVSELVSLFLNGTNLRSVTLRFGHWEYPPIERSSLEPLLALLPWVNLKKISLVNGYFQYGELSEHLDKLRPGTCILLEEVHLLSGLWVDLLDVIRAKADCHSDVIYPEGCEDAETTGAFANQFQESNRKSSPAAAYIRGQITDNPLRSLADQGNMDTEDTDEED